jgi:hypothetical protein
MTTAVANVLSVAMEDGMGLVREVVGRAMIFVLVTLVFLCGPLLGAFRFSHEAGEESDEPLAGDGGREVWGSLWEAAALAAAPPVVEPPPAEPADMVAADVAPNPEAGEARGEDEGTNDGEAGGAAAATVADEGPRIAGVSGTREGGAPAARSGAGTPGKAKGKRCEYEPVPGIAPNGENKWIVHRDLVQIYTRSFAKLDSLGWSKRHIAADGKADGMQIGGVRCNSDLHRAGIRSGDIVHSVNGRGVTSILDALFVYGKVKKDDIIRVELTRKGERKTFVYRMVG